MFGRSSKKREVLGQRLDRQVGHRTNACTITAHWQPVGLLVPCIIPLDLAWTQFQELVMVWTYCHSVWLEPLSSNHRHRVLLDGNLLGDPIYLWKHQLYFNKIEHDKLRLWGRMVNLNFIQHNTACNWGCITVPMHGVRVEVIFERHVVEQCESFCCYNDCPNNDKWTVLYRFRCKLICRLRIMKMSISWKLRNGNHPSFSLWSANI
jgi:hypothetical protein